jgi:hypothetical protein
LCDSASSLLRLLGNSSINRDLITKLFQANRELDIPGPPVFVPFMGNLFECGLLDIGKYLLVVIFQGMGKIHVYLHQLALKYGPLHRYCNGPFFTSYCFASPGDIRDFSQIF